MPWLTVGDTPAAAYLGGMMRLNPPGFAGTGLCTTVGSLPEPALWAAMLVQQQTHAQELIRLSAEFIACAQPHDTGYARQLAQLWVAWGAIASG
jgi:hypothetical protein